MLSGTYLSCISCQASFYVPPARLKKNPKYCSYSCYWKNKHDKPWNTGTKGATGSNRTSFKPLGYRFKGTRNEYKSLHYQINKSFGKPDICENCGKSNLSGKKIVWANKSGNYRNNRED